LKVKRFHDSEAEVVRHEPGKGRHAGRLGALTVRLPNGKEFSVGTGLSDRERESPPPLGSLIRFRYQELSDAGIPRFPSYVGLRSDMISAIAQPTDEEVGDPPAAARRIRVSSKRAIAKEFPTKELPSGESTASRAASSATATTSAATETSQCIYFELVEGSSSKFWEVRVEGSDLTTRWGRIGTDGQSKTKNFATPEKARTERDKLVAEKAAKGYRELTTKIEVSAED
jgi:DNA ligase-1